MSQPYGLYKQKYAVLSRKVVRHNESIDEIKKSLDALAQEMRNGFLEQKRDLDETTVGSYRSSIYHMHHEFMEQAYATRSGLKTFSEMIRIYEKHGGNDIVHSKLAPEVLALPIKEEE